MARRVKAYFCRPDGTPWPYESVLAFTVDRIREASAAGQPLRLSSEQVRALDWAVIRESGGVDTDNWRLSSFDDSSQEPAND